MNDDEFREHMCGHMERQTTLLENQTDILSDLSAMAKQYRDTRTAVKVVFRFLAWVSGFTIGGLAIWDFIRSLFHRP